MICIECHEVREPHAIEISYEAWNDEAWEALLAGGDPMGTILGPIASRSIISDVYKTMLGVSVPLSMCECGWDD